VSRKRSTDTADLTAVSLFSSAGIGELGLREAGIRVLASNELLKDRHSLYAANFPEVRCFDGDIWAVEPDLIDFVRGQLNGDELFLLYATPPCQGMSSNGMGRLNHEVRAGTRPPVDERNRLIIPAVNVIRALNPRWILLENVPGMAQTAITDDSGKQVQILDFIREQLGDRYVGCAEVFACADFGIAQTRKRLITIYTRDPEGIAYFEAAGGTFAAPTDRQRPITLREAIGHLPPLDARLGRNAAPGFHPMHRVPVMSDEKYWWVSQTPEGDTAYNNQCVVPSCGFTGNPLHKDVKSGGRWQSNKQTPFFCESCGALLPRPTVVDKKTGKRRLIKGFHSAYRRMKWDEPARSLTKNLLFEASDNKIHPEQNRVLSLYEAMVIQSVASYDYTFADAQGRVASDGLIAKILGESVPPKLIELFARRMIDLSSGRLPTLAVCPARRERLLFE
jgi:DNA (cytosine-5)-methyltransferase 1